MMTNHNVHAIITYLSGDATIAPHASVHVATAGVAAIRGQAAQAGACAGVRKDLTKPPQGGGGGKGGGKCGGKGAGGGKGGGSASGVVTYLKNRRAFKLCNGY